MPVTMGYYVYAACLMHFPISQFHRSRRRRRPALGRHAPQRRRKHGCWGVRCECSPHTLGPGPARQGGGDTAAFSIWHAAHRRRLAGCQRHPLQVLCLLGLLRSPRRSASGASGGSHQDAGTGAGLVPVLVRAQFRQCLRGGLFLSTCQIHVGHCDGSRQGESVWVYSLCLSRDLL